MAAKEFGYGVGIFFGIIAVILIVIFFLAWIFLALAFFVCIIFIIMIIAFVVIALLLLFAIPYFAVTKKPEVQYGGGYKLDDVKDKDDDKAPKKQHRKKYSLKDREKDD